MDSKLLRLIRVGKIIRYDNYIVGGAVWVKALFSRSCNIREEYFLECAFEDKTMRLNIIRFNDEYKTISCIYKIYIYDIKK